MTDLQIAILLAAVAAWQLIMASILDTNNGISALSFKVVPILFSIALLAAAGFLIWGR